MLTLAKCGEHIRGRLGEEMTGATIEERSRSNYFLVVESLEYAGLLVERGIPSNWVDFGALS